MRPSEGDRLRAGISDAQLSSELNLKDRMRPEEGGGPREEQPLDRALASRLGRPLSEGDGAATDSARLGFHLASLDAPVPSASIARVFGWTVDRFSAAKSELADQLPAVGLALFEYAGELLEIGPLQNGVIDPVGGHSVTILRRDSIALKGISSAEASLLRNALEYPLSTRGKSPRAMGLVKSLLRAGLIRERGSMIEPEEVVRSVFNAGQLPSRTGPIR